MKKLISLLLLCVVGQFSLSPAFATVVTIEPDDFAAGTNISHAIPGVVISSVSTTLDYTDASGPHYKQVLGSVYSHQVSQGCTVSEGFPCVATGDQVFGFQPGAEASSNGTLWGSLVGGTCETGCTTANNLIDHVLRLDFAAPIDYLDVLGYFSGGDPVGVLSNGSGASADCVVSDLDTGPASCAQRYDVPHPFPLSPHYGWGRVSISSASADITTVYIGGFLNWHQLDQIRFNTVPEPSVLALFGLGLIGVGLTRRRKSEPRATR